MTDRPVRLFSYGTLQQAAVQLANFGRRLDGTADTLPGYRRAMVTVTDPEVIAESGTDQHPIVSPSPDPADRVDGTVFEITAEELAAADAYEVADYRRVQVRLDSGLDAWVYVKA
ncbi:gamma-glutamylcyclotransferase family protein [Phenylobacterium sp.]|uniref:gamma-glutamylcyclotransferase family protein n=1 Tax=Phenylobacterium sp. TaxID=1871053 RepID=UPI001217CAED|nr:gamma-glutamylcyclotransferase family protein [Phenylobacterium sp.]THD63699.1 MAG: gamma-glutamylcyclotransferase [Phenylobacterium sp.]